MKLSTRGVVIVVPVRVISPGKRLVDLAYRDGSCGEVPFGKKLLLSGYDQVTANPVRIPLDAQL